MSKLHDLWLVLTGKLASSKQLATADLVTQNLRLVQQLRRMDQFVFRMSQCTDWSSMQPIFLEAKEETDQRMQIENKRIRTLMVEEVRKAYSE